MGITIGVRIDTRLAQEIFNKELFKCPGEKACRNLHEKEKTNRRVRESIFIMWQWRNVGKYKKKWEKG